VDTFNLQSFGFELGENTYMKEASSAAPGPPPRRLGPA
jgi:hypothetical protein